MECTWCDGSGKNGHDRCYPPNEYICYMCNGKGKVDETRHRVINFITNLMYPKNSNISFTGIEAALQYLEVILPEIRVQSDEGIELDLEQETEGERNEN